MKPDSLIFDIDGTLWDTRSLVAESYNNYFLSIGRPDLHVDLEFMSGIFGKTRDEIRAIMFDTFGDRLDREHLLACMSSHRGHMFDVTPEMAFPGVTEGLRALAKDYRLFIVSNSQQGYPDLLMDTLGIRDLIEATLCHGDTGTCKGETIRTLMQRHHISSAIYMGDTQSDLEACEIAGIPFIWCRYGFGKPVRFDGVIDAFDQLPEAVKKL